MGTRVLVFDDVEDQFAVGELGVTNILLEWELMGELQFALTRF
jgi:hypothetical protein